MLLCQREFSEPASVQTQIFSQLQSGVLVKCLPLRTISWISQLRFCYPNLCLGIWYAFVSFGIHGNIILVLHQILHPHLSIYVGIPQISRKKCRYILDTTQNHRRIKHEFWWNRWKMVPNHSFDSISKSKLRWIGRRYLCITTYRKQQCWYTNQSQMHQLYDDYHKGSGWIILVWRHEKSSLTKKWWGCENLSFRDYSVLYWNKNLSFLISPW